MKYFFNEKKVTCFQHREAVEKSLAFFYFKRKIIFVYEIITSMVCTSSTFLLSCSRVVLSRSSLARQFLNINKSYVPSVRAILVEHQAQELESTDQQSKVGKKTTTKGFCSSSIVSSNLEIYQRISTVQY